MQTLLIGVGAVVGSWLPYILTNVWNVPNQADTGIVPTNVIWSFYIGAVVLVSAIVWTVSTTKEYPPEFYESEEPEVV